MTSRATSILLIFVVVLAPVVCEDNALAHVRAGCSTPCDACCGDAEADHRQTPQPDDPRDGEECHCVRAGAVISTIRDEALPSAASAVAWALPTMASPSCTGDGVWGTGRRAFGSCNAGRTLRLLHRSLLC